MKTAIWIRAKSDFNHGWLKNRLVVALSRARKVIDGSVQDDDIWDDLCALLSQWPARRAEALEVLDNYPSSASPRAFIAESSVANTGPDIACWLGCLAHRRWSQAEKPGEKILTAKAAVALCDARAMRLMGAVVSSRGGCLSSDLPPAISELNAAAVALGESFSALGSVAI